MSSNRLTFLASAAVAALIAQPASAQDANTVSTTSAPEQENPTDAPGATRPDNQRADIIVTAQRREQTLVEVPQSISVVTGATLERQQATSFEDYAQLVPGLTLQQSNPGESRLVLRGVNTGSVGSTVAVYVDDVPFGSSSSLGNAATLAGDFDAFDVSRVEVLRGPQGTLYGANALGGVLKFITTAPQLGKVEARGQAGIEDVRGGDIGYSGNAMLNVPLGDMAAVRATGFYRKNGGFIDATGRPGRDINGSESYGGRASLLFQPSDAFSARVTALAQNIRVDSPTSYDADPVTLKPLATDPITGAATGGDYRRAETFPNFADVDYRLYDGVLNYDFGFANLTSVTSYGELKQHNGDEVTFAELAPGLALGDVLSANYGAFAGVTNPVGALQEGRIRTRKFAQEVRLASSDNDRFEWLIGGYYTKEKVRLFQRYLISDRVTNQLIDPTISLPVGPGGTLVTFPEFVVVGLSSQYREYAAFASATIHFGDRFDVTGGVRYSHNKQFSAQTLDGAQLGGAGPLNFIGSSKEDVWTWNVSPRFEVNDRVSLYARVAKGFRPGGPNVIPPGVGPEYPSTFRADTLVSYEVGVRGETPDKTFSLDAALFYLDWKDVLIFGSFPSALGPIGANDNGDKARSKGGEVTATLRPTDGFTVLGTLAYTDAELRGDTPPVTGGLDGDRLPYSPKWSGNVSADYEWPVGDDATAFIGGNIRFIDDQGADFLPAYRAAFGRRLTIDGYATVDLRAGVDVGRFNITAFARNLTDSRGLTNAAGLGARPAGAIAASPIRPRTIGATVGFGF